MVQTQDWLPVGSVVHVSDKDGLYFIIGYLQMSEDGIWDYSGRPFPMGYMGDEYDVYFNREDIDGLYAIGCQDISFDQHQNYLKSQEEGLANLKKQFDAGATIDEIRSQFASNAGNMDAGAPGTDLSEDADGVLA